ncbi:hypothetical protein [Pseudomonas brassicacearum]|uniref:Uncharacterized protein n=1 Tax=Pseudomonas brassicacearum TaxID=930166 RepID=A0A423GP69_9PSED|nr:hypothetical protein [Pseudomonas brassicacearum]ROM94434.1 hypothetical protein BK658_17940 [Pseudomonas brassicacearum]
MPTENNPVQPLPSLATGHPLSAATWADFVQRLHHDCVGAGVRSHGTAAALFTVQTKRIDYGFDPEYAEGRVVCLEDRSWFSPKEYWDDLDDEERAELDESLQADRECGFLDLDEDDQWEYLSECDSHTVTGWNKRWEIVNSHFTKDAAEAFIRRKKHDYGEMRVYVESQYYAWEFEAIKEAILDGTLTYTPKPVLNAHDLVSMEIVG